MTPTRLYVCSACGIKGQWRPGWRHYGSIASDEGCGHRVVVCSPACAESADGQALVSTYELRHSLGSCGAA